MSSKSLILTVSLPPFIPPCNWFLGKRESFAPISPCGAVQLVPLALVFPLNWQLDLLLLLSGFSRVRLCVTPQTAAHQAPLSLGFSRQEYWSGLPFPSPVGPRDLIIFRFNFMILQGHFTECAGYLYHLIVRCTLAGPPFNGTKIISELKPISLQSFLSCISQDQLLRSTMEHSDLCGNSFSGKWHE